MTMEFRAQKMQSELQNNVPPKFRNAYDRVTLAASKLMFDKKISQAMLEAVDDKQSPEDVIADNASGLILMLNKQTKNTIPQQILIPAAIDIALQMSEFFSRTGKVAVDEQVLASAIQKMIFKLFEAFGVKQDQLMGGIAKMQQLDMQKKRMGG